MKHYLLLLIGFSLITQTFSQKIENVKFEQKGETIVVTYDIAQAKNGQYFNVDLYYSANGGAFTGPIKSVKGDIGKGLQGGFGKRIEWDVLKDVNELESDNLVFKISAAIIGTGDSGGNSGGTDNSLNAKALSPSDYDIFKTKALEKTASLSSYMETIIDKSIADDVKIKSVDLAVKLFQDETKTVEVSTKGATQSRFMAIRQYLNRLRVLPFSKVQITWFDVNFVSEFKQGTDGKYYALVSVFQKFEGYKDNKLVYSDITQKQIEIVLENKERKMGDIIIKQWDVMLGNIAVIETK